MLTTAFRVNTASPERRRRVRTVPDIVKETGRQITGARLIRLDDLSHAPEIEVPARFLESLREAIQ